MNVSFDSSKLQRLFQFKVLSAASAFEHKDDNNCKASESREPEKTCDGTVASFSCELLLLFFIGRT